ncbi:MAG: serine hydrolase [Patescibacteria group bacterium]
MEENKARKIKMLKSYSNNDQLNFNKHKKYVLILGILAAVLIMTNTATGAWLWKALRVQESFKKRYPLIDISRNFTPQEHFITNIESLRKELRELVAKEGSDFISLYFEYLNTGANISINPDLNIWPASLAKLPLAMVVMKKVENGVWSLDNELVMMEQDKDTHSGVLYKNAIGTRFTIETLLQELLSNSDNTAYRILLRNITSDELAGIIEAVGLDDLFKADGRVSAKEYSRLPRALYVSSFLKRDNSQKILQWLADSSFQEYLSSGLPDNILFAHKFGENEQFSAYADSGIAYVPNRPYLLTVMIQKKGNTTEDREKVKELMKSISEKTYNYVANY